MKQSSGVEWPVVELEKSSLKCVAALAHGWHSLVSNATSGALDYIRSPEFQPKAGCVFVVFNPILEALRRLLQSVINFPWKKGTSIDALTDQSMTIEPAKSPKA